MQTIKQVISEIRRRRRTVDNIDIESQSVSNTRSAARIRFPPISIVRIIEDGAMKNGKIKAFSYLALNGLIELREIKNMSRSKLCRDIRYVYPQNTKCFSKAQVQFQIVLLIADFVLVE